MWLSLQYPSPGLFVGRWVPWPAGGSEAAVEERGAATDHSMQGTSRFLGRAHNIYGIPALTFDSPDSTMSKYYYWFCCSTFMSVYFM